MPTRSLSQEKYPLPQAKIAMPSMRGCLCSIAAELPDLPEKIDTECYEAVKLGARPERYMKIKPELLLIHEKGAGFWSHELHV